MSRGSTLHVQVDLVTEECCNCGVLFAIPSELRDRLVSKKTVFYCPNGHDQHYLGESDAAKAKRLAKELEEAKEREKWALTDAQNAWRMHDDEQRARKVAEKAQRLADRRASAAMCPVDGCHRQIQQMARHLRSKHPEFVHTEVGH